MTLASKIVSHAGKGKLWWTKDEAVDWVVFRGHTHGIPRQGPLDQRYSKEKTVEEWLAKPGKSRLVSRPELLRIIAAGIAATYEQRKPGEVSAYSATALIKAEADLLAAAKIGKIKTKPPKRDAEGGALRFQAKDVRETWPAKGGRGGGSPPSLPDDRKFIIRLARAYLETPEHVSRDKAIELFEREELLPDSAFSKSMGSGRFQRIRMIALRVARATVEAEYESGRIDDTMRDQKFRCLDEQQ